MHEVLDNLFGDIAEAIRSRTRTNGDIKPSEFAERINDISIIGESLSLDLTTGSFEATSEVMTVEHNVGKVPDILIVYPSHVPQLGDFTYMLGFSKALMHSIKNYDTKYPAKVAFVIRIASTGEAGGYLTHGSKYGFDEVGEEDQVVYGHIRGVTDTSFTVGSSKTNYPHTIVGLSYDYLAITGFLY